MVMSKYLWLSKRRLVRRKGKEISEEYKVESFMARDSNHALVVEKGEEKYRLNSAYRPLEEAKKWAEQYGK